MGEEKGAESSESSRRVILATRRENKNKKIQMGAFIVKFPAVSASTALSVLASLRIKLLNKASVLFVNGNNSRVVVPAGNFSF